MLCLARTLFSAAFPTGQKEKERKTITIQGVLPTLVHFCGENIYQVLVELQTKKNIPEILVTF